MPNRLAAEKSPYLRQHADNPVDWHPWGETAFARARTEQKPIFLSIGYSTCHWCHVMAHESFEDEKVAAVLNANFVCIKLDREERPDLDRVYMTYVQLTTGHGGWPMSVWLTPDLKPFYGGTYFPPDDRHGRPGFITLLNAITRHWREQRGKIETGADEVVAALQRHATEAGPDDSTDGPATARPLAETADEALNRALQFFHEAYDATWGGFGGAPKFPRPAALNFLFRLAAWQGVGSEIGSGTVKMAAFTLRKMAEGGMHDHVGGGFHRYSVDATWFVPHFEKMLYDQAQLAVSYLEAKQATGHEVYAWVARGIFDYVLRDLAGPHGGFYSAEDADSPLPTPAATAATEDGGRNTEDRKHAEGAFYVWTKEEIDSVLGGIPVGGVPSPRGNDATPGEGTRPTTDSDFFCAHYGVKAGGNVEHDPQGEFTGKNILMQRQSLAVTAREFGLEIEAASKKLLACLEKLRAVRARRPCPSLDDKVITAWNGLMISALAKGHQVLGGGEAGGGRDGPPGRSGEPARPEVAPHLVAATRAAEFIQRELYDATTGTLYRSWREGRSDIAGFAEDYAFLIQGLLDLYEAGFAVRWLQWAVQLQAKMDKLFWDAPRGGYFNSRADDPAVIVRLKEDHDGAEPAPNSVAALNLLRLDWMIGGEAEDGGRTAEDGGRRTEDRLGYRERALKTLEAFRPRWTAMPQGLPQLLCALEMVVGAPRTVVLAGDPAAKDFQALATVLHEQLGPRRALLAVTAPFDGIDGLTAGKPRADGEGQRWLAGRRRYLAEMKPLDGRATAYVCENFACQQPVTQPGELRHLLH